jgi:hypothetical protein
VAIYHESVGAPSALMSGMTFMAESERATVVQVVDGGRGGALKVARAITGIPAFHQYLVLTGQRADDRSLVAEDVAAVASPGF